MMRVVPVFFLACVTLAIPLYPGGNLIDPDQEGYALARNFLSELGGYAAQSGDVNFLSAFFFNMGMFAFTLIAISFALTPQLFAQDRVTKFLATAGSVLMAIGCLFFAAVGLTPHDLYREAHIFAALNAFRLLVPGTLLYVIALWRAGVSRRYLAIGLVFLIGNISYVIYQWASGPPTASMAALTEAVIAQKFMVFLSMANIISFSYAFAQLNIRSANA